LTIAEKNILDKRTNKLKSKILTVMERRYNIVPTKVFCTGDGTGKRKVFWQQMFDT